MSKYIAHSQNNAGEAQTLLQHSQGVADLMRSFSLSKEYEDLFVSMCAMCGILSIEEVIGFFDFTKLAYILCTHKYSDKKSYLRVINSIA